MTLHLNSDFSQAVVIRPEDYHWQPSPAPGVERMMLDRIGNEVARATSLVRYAANTRFPRHHHGGGEEIYVLEGVFADEHGEYPAGSYLRNPIGTGHSPRIGEQGATIFVKLHQFDESDQTQLAVQTQELEWRPGVMDGLSVKPLHQFGSEHTALVRWHPHTQFHRHQHWGGEEILVLDGVFYDEHGRYPQGTWLRSPHLSAHQPFTDAEGATILVKVGHLPNEHTVE